VLTRTFLHIDGVGATTERSLWAQGCEDWDGFLADPSRYSVGTAGTEAVERAVRKSKSKLEKREHQFFRRALGLAEAWRAWPEFRDSCVYLDIETDGGSSGNSITTIGLYDGKEYVCLIQGQDLENFRDLITRYSMIVTFFGSGFDVPMLSKRFPDVKFDQIHLDLCPTLRRIGLHGGLKKIERELGIDRGEETAGLDGLAAIRLWRAYRMQGNERALRTLIAYNRQDVVNLETLAQYAYDHLRAQVTAGVCGAEHGA
jgi:hypothetical protein